MAIILFLFSLFLFVLTFAYHYGASTTTPIKNLNVTRISNEERYQHYLYFSRSERLSYREKARDMFQFGYDNYMKYAFPQDELDPIHCRGRGPDIDRPYEIDFLYFSSFFVIGKIIISMMYWENFL
jgi:hypothetical protein